MESDEESCSEFEEPAQILYDIVPYKEWEQEPEVVKYADKNGQKARVSYWPFNSQSSSALPGAVESILSHRLPWLFAVSQDANLVAILQENTLEVWHSKENYGTLVGRRTIRRDPNPSWRCLAWNEDNQLLAIAYSDGNIEICDTVGGMMYQIISPQIPASQPPASNSSDNKIRGPSNLTYVNIFFTNVRIRDKKWISELIVVDVGGRILSFLVSSSGYQELSNFSVGWNLTSAVYCSKHNLLITSGESPLLGRSTCAGKACSVGIHSYRLTNDSPHYVSTLDESDQAALLSRGFTFPFMSNKNLDYVVSMSVDESGRRLGAIHESGSISLWLLPGLFQDKQVNLAEQPAFDEVNPQLLQVPGKKKLKQEFLANEHKFHPSAISWWNAESVIICRVSGALSVLKLDNLTNLLGDAPEFLDGVPRLSQTFEKGFFALECESVIKGRRQSTKSESAGGGEDPDNVDVEVEESDDEDRSWVQLGKRSAAAVAYFMTDNERFAPPKKKSKIVRRTYRMIALISTTPDELYARKIENEEYGEAIMLAQHYRLDTDPVYERQWKKSNKSVAAIHDYLGKIKRRICVIKECLETIPMDIDATRELLQYGLSGTDLETLIALADKDTGEFIRSDRGGQHEDEWFEDNTSPDRQREIRAEREKAKMLKLISKVNWQSLSLVQKDLIASRLKFIYYLDILDIYEDALGGGQRAADKYDTAVYWTMRSLSPLENCLTAARAMDAITIAAFFSSFYSDAILPHWLPILSAFPETTKPDVMIEILPSLNMEGSPVPWLAALPRTKDWCEQALSMKWSGHKVEWDPAILYLEDASLDRFKDKNLNTRMVTEWYEWRARTVTMNTSIPELGLDLLQRGIERNVEISMKLINDLRTLDALVYDVQVEIDLSKFEAMSEAEKMSALLSRTTDLLQDIRSLLLPFLLRMDDAEPGQFIHLLYTFCIHKAEKDLTIPLTIIDNSRPSTRNRILENIRQVVQLGIDCCYAHGSGQQIDYLDRISYCIREIFESSRGGLRLDVIQAYNLDVNQYRAYMQHIEIAKIMHRNGVNKPLSILRDGSKDLQLMKKVFDQINCNAERMRPPLDQDGWRCVLKDLQRLQKLIPVVPLDSVFYAFTESLLASGFRENIELAGEVLKTLMEESDQVKVVLTAWKHYFSTSTNLNDPNIALAKQCLRLITFTNKEISECFDLISSLQSLADFGLPDVHPFSVLNSKNRIEFVTMALNSKPTAYRNSQRLMKLATLLRIEENMDSLEGMVWVLVARKALEAVDYSSCLLACDKIILNNYTQGWDICFALGVQEGFTDLPRCQDLLSFAVAHCDPENIENIILSQLKVEQKMFHQGLSNKPSDETMNQTNGTVNDSVFEKDEGIDEDNFEDTVEELRSREVSPMPPPSVTSLLSYRDASPFPSVVTDMKNKLLSVASVPDMKTRIMTVTSMSSQYLLDNNISKSVLDRTSFWLHQIALKESHNSFCEDDATKKLDKILLPAFYATLFSEQDDIEDNRIDITYKRFSGPQQELDLIRAAQQSLRSHVISHVLEHLINNKLDLNGIKKETMEIKENGTNDTNDNEVENCDDKIEGGIPEEVLHEVISSLANQDFYQGLGAMLSFLPEDRLEDFLLSLPQSKPVINIVLVYLSILIYGEIEKTNENGNLFEMVTPKILLTAVLKDGKKTELYKTLNKFLEIAADHSQAGVLSSLAGDIDVSRFSKDQQYKEDTILGLARSLETANWDFTCRLASRYNVDPWIVTATHMEAVLVETEDAQAIKDIIQKQDLVTVLQQDGERWKEWSSQKIYPLLDGSNLEKLQFYYNTMREITSDQVYGDHSAVIANLIDNGVKIDYFSLLRGDKNVLKSVTVDNIEPVAKALALIPDLEVGRLMPADAYLYLANMEFNRRGQEKGNWADACAKCQNLLEKLDTASLKQFTTDAILSENSIDNISRNARVRVLKKLITVVEIKIAIKSDGDWQEMLSWFQQLKSHIDSFHSQLTSTILQDFPSSCNLLISKLEQTGGQQDEILDLFVDILGQHTRADVVRKLIVIWKQDESKIDEAFEQIFNYCMESLLNSEEIKPDNKMADCIQYLIEELEFSTANTRNQLMPLCTLEKLSVAHRLMFVQLVKRTSVIESEENEGEQKEEEMFDSSFLAEMYEVEARLQELVPGIRITDQDLVNEQAKADLIQRICQDVKDLACLEKLSEFAIEFLSSNPSLQKICLNHLVDYGLQLKKNKDDFVQFIYKLSDNLDPDDVERVLGKCKQIDEEIFVKLVCELELENKYKEISQIVCKLENLEDSTLASLIQAGLGAEFASTELYARVMEVAISEEIADKLVEQLKEAGYRAQACSLQLMALRIPGALRTMASFKF